MIPNSCSISCLAKTFGLSILSVHRTALALGIDCKINGLTYEQQCQVINRLRGKGYKPKNKYMVTVVDDTPEYHSILALGSDTYWCPNYGYLDSFPKQYFLINLIRIADCELIDNEFCVRDVVKWCNANCNKRITKRKVVKWFDPELDPIALAIQHVNQVRMVTNS